MSQLAERFRCLGCGRRIIADPPEDHVLGCRFVVTLEQLCPEAAVKLSLMRDSGAARDVRKDAARWLKLNGYDRHPDAPKDEIHDAAHGIFKNERRALPWETK